MRLRLALISTVACVLAGFLYTFPAGAAVREDQPTPIVRGKHVSGFVRFAPNRPPRGGGGGSGPKTCGSTSSTNNKPNCNGTGRPVNETWIAAKPTAVPTGTPGFVAGANDYNSYNGQGQDGFYWSDDGHVWNDAGPLDLFPHNTNNAAGDPGVAIGSDGTVYYSSLFFNFNRCGVGGVELLRRNPTTKSWSYYQIAANSSAQFQDKPTLAVDDANSKVWVSWTQFGSCTGIDVTSPIKVAVFGTGPSSGAPSSILNVPDSQYSQGSSLAADGSGGFWTAWDEYPSSTATTGSLRIAHYTGSGWATLDAGSGAQSLQISPQGFTDLPSPLPGFSFRTDSFPALTVTASGPQVAWTSNDTGAGCTYLWTQAAGSVSTIDCDTNDDFFPAIAADGAGGDGVYVSFSKVTQINSRGKPTGFDQFLWHSGDTAAAQVSTASSYPNNDAFFSGQFIGDYNGLAVSGGKPYPIWTDLRGADPNYPGYEMDAMAYAGL